MKHHFKVFPILIAMAFLSVIDWNYFSGFMSLTMDAAMEFVQGGNVAVSRLEKELDSLSVDKFIKLDIEELRKELDKGKETEDNVYEEETTEVDTDAKDRYCHLQNIEGLNKIREHLEKDVDGLDFIPNQIMLQKIEELLLNNQALTGAYKNFYDHELTEDILMDESNSYEQAHKAALEIHNVLPQALYPLEIVEEYYKWFNKKDYEYWGLDIN